MSKNFKYYCYPIAMSNGINFGGVGGGQNEEVLKYDISLFFLPNFLLLNLFDV